MVLVHFMSSLFFRRVIYIVCFVLFNNPVCP